MIGFFERCLPLRASDVDFVSDVHCVNDVTPDGVVGKHHITVSVANHIIMRSITSLLRQQKHHEQKKSRHTRFSSCVFALSACNKGLGLAHIVFVQTNAMLVSKIDKS